MMNSKRFFARVAVGTTVLLAAVAFPKPATADLSVLNFGFENLASNFVSLGPTTGTFTAISSSALLAVPTLGTVTRTVFPEGWAIFSWDADAPDIGQANVDLTLNLTSISQVTNTADATGTIEMKDVQGQTIAGTVAGTWSLDPFGIAHFDGTAFNLVFNPEEGGTFDGNLFSPGFDMDFTDFDQILGSIVDLASVPVGGFFLNTWEIDGDIIYVDSNIESLLIPAPGAFLLGAMGLAGVGWLKRRVA